MTNQTFLKSNGSNISNIKAFECLDSRGFPTLSVTIELENGILGTAMVPSGASTGEHEAHELRDEDANRYSGKGVLKAVANVNDIISKKLSGYDVRELTALDRELVSLDGTPQKYNLGANAMLGVSLAAARAGANYQNVPLFRYLGGVNARRLPTPMVNIINGGAHANNSLDFQEFMIIPHASGTFFENIRIATEVFHTLKANLQKKNLSTGLGDEGGFSPELASSEEALTCLMEAIDDAGYQAGDEVSLALDVAASEFYDKDSDRYILKKGSGDSLTAKDLISLYDSFLSKYPIVSIEDGLDENDWNGWQAMTKKLSGKTQLVGDDLFVTNVSKLSRGIELGVANSILIKLNQIGTVTETLETIALAQENAYRCVISHRSGETEDTSIADLSVAVSAGQIKTGSVCRSERTAKYNRLLWIETYLAGEGFMEYPFGYSDSGSVV